MLLNSLSSIFHQVVVNLKKKIIIGRKDKADFPDLELRNIDLKVDTGAYTSAIHCHKISTHEVDGQEILTFTLLDPSHRQYDDKEFTTDSFSVKRIKNSFGGSEQRFIIKTTIRLFGKRYPLELSLSERGEMKFPILIGRKFLMGNFIVDPSKYDLSLKQKRLSMKNKKTK